MGVRPQLDGLGFKSLEAEDRKLLKLEFDMDETKEAMWPCDGSKSPGSDRFNFRYIKEN